MSMDNHGGMILTGEPKNSEKNLSQRHLADHNIHTDRLGCEPWPLRWEVGDLPSEPWHGQLYPKFVFFPQNKGPWEFLDLLNYAVSHYYTELVAHNNHNSLAAKGYRYWPLEPRPGIESRSRIHHYIIEYRNPGTAISANRRAMLLRYIPFLKSLSQTRSHFHVVTSVIRCGYAPDNKLQAQDLRSKSRQIESIQIK
jgi:hypothetical protein